MKRFIQNTLKLTLLIIVLVFACDLLYTAVYRNGAPRNKLQYILNTENETFDIVFLGSSRVANHVDTKLFDSLSHKKTINLGVLGAGLNDNFLQLKLLIQNNQVNSVYLQIDDNFEREYPTALGTASAMPFIRNTIIKEHTKRYFDNFNTLYYIPFYRYAINDPKIGFRELFFSSINKAPKIDPSVGYIPKYGSRPSQSGSLPKEIAKENAILKEIRALCKVNSIELVLFISPYSSTVKNRDYIGKLKNKVPDLLDVTKGYNDSLFYNYGHLNNKGARVFTKNLYYATQRILE